jgi:hypothetical protein
MARLNGNFPQYHYELLNEIHNQRAARKVVAPHAWTKAELDAISHKVGDVDESIPPRNGQFEPIWTRSRQPDLVARTLAAMGEAHPHIDDDAV